MTKTICNTISLTVRECSEFPSLGVCYDGLSSVDEAFSIYKSLPSQYLKSISICVFSGRESEECDIVVGRRIECDMLQYYPLISGSAVAMDMVEQLKDRMEREG